MAVAISRDDKYVLQLDEHGVRRFRVEDGALLAERRFTEPVDDFADVELAYDSHNTRVIYWSAETGNRAGSLDARDLTETWTTQMTFAAPGSPPAFHPSEPTAAFAVYGDCVELRHLSTGERIGVLHARRNEIGPFHLTKAVGYSADGLALITDFGVLHAMNGGLLAPGRLWGDLVWQDADRNVHEIEFGDPASPFLRHRCNGISLPLKFDESLNLGELQPSANGFFVAIEALNDTGSHLFLANFMSLECTYLEEQPRPTHRLCPSSSGQFVVVERVSGEIVVVFDEGTKRVLRSPDDSS